MLANAATFYVELKCQSSTSTITCYYIFHVWPTLWRRHYCARGACDLHQFAL